MSWDLTLLRFDRTYESAEDISSTTAPLRIGSQAEVQQAIEEVFAGTEWEGPQAWGLWGRWASGEDSIEFNIGHNADEVDSVGLQVRANDGVVAGIVALATRLSCQALDFSTGYFIQSDADPARGLREWRAYRDHVAPR